MKYTFPSAERQEKLRRKLEAGGKPGAVLGDAELYHDLEMAFAKAEARADLWARRFG